jgi:hypothetical protein
MMEGANSAMICYKKFYKCQNEPLVQQKYKRQKKKIVKNLCLSLVESINSATLNSNIHK